MRLIDADFEIQYWKDILCNPTPDVTQYDKESAPHVIEALKLAATVDAVEVVRCRDCKHWVRGGNESYGYAMFCIANCSLGGQGIKKPDDYCSYGERRNDG